MRTGISNTFSAKDRLRLEALVSNGNTAQKHARRCLAVLLTADGCGTAAIMRETGFAKTGVWRWQERFMQAGVDGLLRDKTRPPGQKPAAAGRAGRGSARREPRAPDCYRSKNMPPVTSTRIAAVAPMNTAACRHPTASIAESDVPRPRAAMASNSPHRLASPIAAFTGR